MLNWVHHHLIPHSVPVLQFISDTSTFVSIALTLFVIIIAVIKKSKPMRVRFFILVTVLILAAAVVAFRILLWRLNHAN